MRVCYVLPRPELGGGNKVVVQQAHLLRSLGWEVTILGDGAAPSWIRLEVPYFDYQTSASGLRTQDLVVATFWTTLAVGDRLGIGPLAHFCQGYEGGLRHLRPQLADIDAAYARRLPTLTVAPHLAALLATRFGRESAPAPPVVDNRFRPAFRVQPHRLPWIAIPGIFEAPVKGLRTALAAVARMRARGLPCRVLRFSVLPLSHAERELLEPDRYLCAVPPDEIAAALRRCDLLLLASEPEEGFGLPLLEAMAAKVPAIASRIPSTEYIAGAASLVPVGDADAFAAAALELLTDAARWRRARRHGHAAAERFRPGAVAPVLVRSLTWARQKALGLP
jgi:hypothetical protein